MNKLPSSWDAYMAAYTASLNALIHDEINMNLCTTSPSKVEVNLKLDKTPTRVAEDVAIGNVFVTPSGDVYLRCHDSLINLKTSHVEIRLSVRCIMEVRQDFGPLEVNVI